MQPERVGPYRVEGVLGRGGMGTVYLAVRDDHEYERKVAVKVLNVGMDRPENVRRFLQERQILADLEHGHIAKMLEGGHLEDGQPFLVMEYVDGMPLVEYCEQKGVERRGRVVMLEKVCEAVHYAHRHLIVHRDIKPSNILVNQDGEPKLMDFGIAKVLAEGQEKTQQTEQLLTLEYASPEQVKGEAISTATDIYALGVVMYELLSGQKPFGTRDAMALAYAIIYTDPAPMVDVPRELEAIARKAMAKEPQRRYASAAEMAEDLRRFLDGRPVMARGDSSLYIATKFVRRNRPAVALATLLVGAIGYLGGQLAASNQRLEKERDTALRERRVARRMSDFMVDLFDSSNPMLTKGKEMSAREMLEAGAKRLEQSEIGDALVKGNLEMGLGTAFLRLGRWKEARVHLEESLRLLKGGDASTVDVRIDALNEYVNVLETSGDLKQAEASGRELVELTRKERPQRLQTALTALANSLSHQMKYAEAEKVYRESIALAKPDDDVVITAKANLGIALFRQGKFEESRKFVSETMELMRKYWGADTPSLAMPYDTLANLEMVRGDYPASLQAADAALKIVRGLGQDGRSMSSYQLCAVAETYLRMGDVKGALPSLNECATIRRETVKPGSFDMLAVEQLEGWRALLEGDYSLAGKRFREGLDGYTKMFGVAHLTQIKALRFVGMAALESGNVEGAEEQYRQAFAVCEKIGKPEDIEYFELLREAGKAALVAGRNEQAGERLRKALEIAERLGMSANVIAEARVRLGEALTGLGQLEEAQKLITPQTGEGKMALARLRDRQGKTAEAAQLRASARGEVAKMAPGRWRDWVQRSGQ